jgi:hypothetical protein
MITHHADVQSWNHSDPAGIDAHFMPSGLGGVIGGQWMMN